jgi:hypothetical protein
MISSKLKKGKVLNIKDIESLELVKFINQIE